MTPAEIFNSLEAIRNLSQIKVDKKDQDRLNELLKEPMVEQTEKEKTTRLKTIQGLQKKLASNNFEQNQKKIQEKLEELEKKLFQEDNTSWITFFSTQLRNEWTLSEEEKRLNQEQLIKTVPNADVSKYNPIVYAKLLPYAKLLYVSGQKGSPEEHAYKLSVLFDKEEDALKYLNTALNREPPKYDLLLMSSLPKNKKPLKNKLYFENEGKQLKYTMKTLEGEVITGKINIDAPKLTTESLPKLREEILNELLKKGQVKTTLNMDDACSFSLPLGNYDLNIWRKLSLKFLDKPEFRPILSQASAIEGLIKKLEKEKPSATSVEIKKVTNDIEKLNSSFKDLKRKHGQIDTEAKEKEYQDIIRQLIEKRRALTTLGVPFNSQLTLVALESFREIYNIDNSPVLKYFLEHGLTKEDYQKFIKLDRNNAGTNIPDIKLDGAQFGHPGYYFMKVPVQDDLQAARAACLGKLTNCCQSLSGEEGEPCVKYGLTSANSGFYVLCEGDVNTPKVEDKLIGQCWVWRSKSNALVFDSIETSSKDEDIVNVAKDFFEKAAKKLIVEDYTHKVSCGASSGISSEVGIAPPLAVKEFFLDYAGYNDSNEQRLIFDKSRPFYWYNEDEDCASWTKDLLQSVFELKSPLIKSADFQTFINWVIIEDKIDLLDLIKSFAKTTSRENELNQIIESIARFNRGELSDNEILDLIDKNIFFVDTRNKETTTALMQAANKGNVKKVENLIEKGAGVNVQENYKDEDILSEIMQKEMANVADEADAYLQDNYEDAIKNKTALMYAAQNGHISALKLLLSKKASLNTVDDEGLTALMHAAKNGHKECVLELINEGASVELGEGPYLLDTTPLMCATVFAHNEIAYLLIQKGANVNAKNWYGDSSLMMAIKGGDVDLVAGLIKNGASVNAVGVCLMSELPENDPYQAEPHKIYVSLNGDYVTRDPKGVVQKGRVSNFQGINDFFVRMDYDIIEKFIEILVERGHMHPNAGNRRIEKFNALNNKLLIGTSPLMAALKVANQSIVLALIENGADTNVSYAGQTLLKHAQAHKWTNVIEYIQKSEQQQKNNVEPTSGKPITFRKDSSPSVPEPPAKTPNLPVEPDLKNDPTPLNDKLTLVASESVKEKYNIDNSPVLKYFLNNGLTKEDYQKFIKLDRNNAGTNIPDIKLDGAQFGHSGYYFMKVPVQDDLHAARAACLGKLTNSCQSLSGEEGEPCVKYGLTSPNSGFYVLCEGDVNAPKVEDKVIGQSWVWRSKTNALVFDSIKTSSPEDSVTELVKDFFEKATKKLVVENHTHKVSCGDSSGISSKVGIAPLYPTNEYFIDYEGYTEADDQRLMIDITQPFYWYNVDVDCVNLTKDLLKSMFQENLPLMQHPNFPTLINWAMKDDQIDLLTLMKHLSKITKRKNELNQIIENLEKFSRNELTINEIVDLVDKNFFEKGADTNVSYAGQTLLKHAQAHKWTNVIEYIQKSEQQQKNNVEPAVGKPVTFRQDSSSSVAMPPAKTEDLPAEPDLKNAPTKNIKPQ